jgi:hypothetical protein
MRLSSFVAIPILTRHYPDRVDRAQGGGWTPPASCDMIDNDDRTRKAMATKAELEAELAALRRELAQLKGLPDEAAEDDEGHSTIRDFVGSIRDTDLEGLAKQLTDEIESAMHEKPLLTALGILVVGYALGRMR